MEYKVLSDPDNIGLNKAFTAQAKVIEKALRRPIDHHVVTEVEGKIPDMVEEGVILEEEQEISKSVFVLRLLRL
jgi:isoleucyl-tRNA synthetase